VALESLERADQEVALPPVFDRVAVDADLFGRHRHPSSRLFRFSGPRCLRFPTSFVPAGVGFGIVVISTIGRSLGVLESVV
jgi:hypothetical protein